MPGLPPGWRRFAEGRLLLVVRQELAAAARAAGLLSAAAAEGELGAPAAARGRAATARLTLPGVEFEILLRPLRHGGLLGPLLGRTLLGTRRPLGELAVAERLRAAGAPVPCPALVAARRVAGPFWHAAVGTRYEVGTRDVLAFLETHPGRARLLRAATAAGAAVRRFHDAGGCHPDLHLKNLLLRESDGEPEVLVIDLDRARVLDWVGPKERMAELMRLHRSLRKRGVLEQVGRRGVARFFGAYVAGDRSLRRALRSRLRRERIRNALHAVFYRPAGRGQPPAR